MYKVDLPTLNRSITDYLQEEEGFIHKEKLFTVGSLIILANILLCDELYAYHSSHRSHSSHNSHNSHRSHSSHSNYYSY